MSRNLKIEQADLKYAPQKAELTHKCQTSTALIYVVIFYSFFTPSRSLQCLRTVMGADVKVNILVNARAVSQSDSNHRSLKRK